MLDATSQGLADNAFDDLHRDDSRLNGSIQWVDSSVWTLRGAPGDAEFMSCIREVFECDIPSVGCASEASHVRLLRIGPDCWLMVGVESTTTNVASELHAALANTHYALIDVSSSFETLRIAGQGASDILANGCPLDLHPSVFGANSCAGSHFFKAHIWIWPSSGAAGYNLLVRSSYKDYVSLMLDRCMQEHASSRL